MLALAPEWTLFTWAWVLVVSFILTQWWNERRMSKLDARLRALEEKTGGAPLTSPGRQA